MNHRESLLHYIWQYQLFQKDQLATVDGQSVEILKTGHHNTDQGPDFQEAQILIGDVLWAGNIEMHTRSGDWIRHGHNTDPVFNTTILHVVEEVEPDVEICRQDGTFVPQLIIPIPDELNNNYEELIRTTDYPRCYRHIPVLPKIKVNFWLENLLYERLIDRSHRINKILSLTNGNWQHTTFIMLARSMGTGLNSDPMEIWALGHVSNKEVPIVADMWRHMRLRPANYPEVRINQLTRIYCEGTCTFEEIMDAENAVAMLKIFTSAGLSKSTARMLVINAAVPILFTFGLLFDRQELQERARDILSDLKGEDNHILRQWKACKLEVDTAADTQALIQLKKQYCDRQRCLECRWGFEYLSATLAS